VSNHLDGTSLLGSLRRAVQRFRSDSRTDVAAALTYYGLLALFPGLIALVGVLGLFGDSTSTTAALVEIVERIAPSSSSASLQGPIASLIADRGTAGLMFFVGIGTAIWSASGYVGAFIRASNAVYEVDEARPFLRLRPLQLLITLVGVIAVAVTLLTLVLTGPVVDAVAATIGIGDGAVALWDLCKWPVVVAVALASVSGLYYASPNARVPQLREVVPGATLALVIWALASLAFGFYVANFGSYDKTYGTLGGAVSLLVWIWISNLALLLGTQLNAELERSREIVAGSVDAIERLQLKQRYASTSTDVAPSRRFAAASESESDLEQASPAAEEGPS
jgi:membrane protein